MYNFLQIERTESIGIVRFNRPEQLNAMNRKFMDEIVDAFSELNNDNKIKAVVVTGNGRAFMAGADIKEYAEQSEEDFVKFQKKGIEMYQKIEKSTKPYIAMLNGFALGGGFEIACACDLIVAAQEARMGLPEVHLGLIPGGGGTQRLIQKIGINRVKQMLFLGNQYTADEMRQWGIVNYVFPLESLEVECLKLAEKLVRKSSDSMAQLKRLAYLSTCPIDLDVRMKEEGDSVAELFKSEEARNKIQDFIKKNK